MEKRSRGIILCPKTAKYPFLTGNKFQIIHLCSKLKLTHQTFHEVLFLFAFGLVFHFKFN